MALPTREWGIILGHNNGGSTVRWNTLGTGGVTLVDPGDPTTFSQYSSGEPIAREDQSIAFEGFPTTIWAIPIITVALYNYLHTNFQGKLVTIRDTIDGVTFEDYNATFRIEERADMADRWDLFGSDPIDKTGYSGEWGWFSAQVFYNGMEAI